jgi:hypothetical protein
MSESRECLVRGRGAGEPAMGVAKIVPLTFRRSVSRLIDHASRLDGAVSRCGPKRAAADGKRRPVRGAVPGPSTDARDGLAEAYAVAVVTTTLSEPGSDRPRDLVDSMSPRPSESSLSVRLDVRGV